jgi:hypothetical protein
LSGILIVLVVYFTYGFFVTKKVTDLPTPIIKRIADTDNIVVSLNQINNKDLTEQEIELVNNYFNDKTVENLIKAKTVVDEYSVQLNAFEGVMKKSYWFNNNIPENNLITEDLKLPPLGLTRGLARLYILQLENDLVNGAIIKSVYQDKLQQIYDFGNKIENGSYAHIEFLVGKSIKAMAYDQAILNKVNLKESLVSEEIKEQVLLSEFNMSQNFLSKSKKEMRSTLESVFSFSELIPLYIPFTFHKNRTLNYFAAEIPNALSYIENGNCKSYIPIREFHWYDWLTPNSFGKMMLSKALVLPQSLCE